MDYILEVVNLNKTYKDNNFKINNVSFNVPYGAIVDFIGDNGAGKSTVIDLILNIKHKESGVIKLFGKVVEIDDTLIKEKIGVVFDENYFPQMSNAKDISQIFKHLYTNWDEKYFFDRLNQFGISITKKIEDYSKGMKAIGTMSIIRTT